MKFKSNLLGSLGAGLNVKPNMIDFSTVFDDIGQKLLDNIAVLATVLGLILLYIPLVVYLRRLDMIDLMRVSLWFSWHNLLYHLMSYFLFHITFY